MIILGSGGAAKTINIFVRKIKFLLILYLEENQKIIYHTKILIKVY